MLSSCHVMSCHVRRERRGISERNIVPQAFHLSTFMSRFVFEPIGSSPEQSVHKRPAKASDAFASKSVKNGHIYRYTESTCRERHVNLLVAAAKAAKSNPAHHIAFSSESPIDWLL